MYILFSKLLPLINAEGATFLFEQISTNIAFTVKLNVMSRKVTRAVIPKVCSADH
jgi:hypothetical protein